MIELLTFTGVDSETTLEGLSTLSQRYPRVEFGVLLGSQVGGIFPPLRVVEQLATCTAQSDGWQQGYFATPIQ